MTTLITGGAGYIGSHIALSLLDRGQPVVVLDNLETGNRDLVPAQAVFVKADISDTDAVRDALRRHDVDAVVHCAGSTIVPESVSDPIKYYRNNTTGSLSLLEAMVAEGVRRILFSSTAAVYEAVDQGPLDENAPVRPVTPYGKSKHFTETMIGDVAAAHGLSYCILRYFNVAGADPQLRSGQVVPNATHLIKVAVETALGLREKIEVFGTDWPTDDGTCVRDFIHVSDLANVHRLALDYLRSSGENAVLNCGYGRGYSVQDVIESVKKVSGAAFEVSLADRRPGDLGSVIADPGKAASLLQWEPDHADLDFIVACALNWEKKFRSTADQTE